MGADFLFSRFPRFEMTDERELKFEEALQDILSDPNEEVEFLDWFMFEADKTTAFGEIMNALDQVARCQDSREVCGVRDFTEGGYAYINYTGGMSWGDSPTESYDIFNMAGFFPDVFALALKFAQEDYTIALNNSNNEV
jgi:hypothetical protein